MIQYHSRIVRDVVSFDEAFASDLETCSQLCSSKGYHPILGTLLAFSIVFNVLILVATLRVPLYRGVILHVLRTMFANIVYAIRTFALRQDRLSEVNNIDMAVDLLPEVKLLDNRSDQVESSSEILVQGSLTVQDEGSSVRDSLKVVPQSTPDNTVGFIRSDYVVLDMEGAVM